MTEVPAGHPEKPSGEDGMALLERMNGGHHEELALWGLTFLPLEDGARVLDIGCGGGANIGRILERVPAGHVSGVDYSETSVRASTAYNARAIEQGRCDVSEGNASDLPYADASFDAVSAFETVYYWDLPTAFPEVLRVLVPGGRFLVCNEDDGGDPAVLELAKQIPGMVVYTCDQLVAALEEAGFVIDSVGQVPEKGHIAIVACRP